MSTRDSNLQPPPQEEPLLGYFVYLHLPPHLQEVSADFSFLAHRLCHRLPRSAERTVALRKLLEGKDAAVRAALDAWKAGALQQDGTSSAGETPEVSR